MVSDFAQGLIIGGIFGCLAGFAYAAALFRYAFRKYRRELLAKLGVNVDVR